MIMIQKDSDAELSGANANANANANASITPATVHWPLSTGKRTRTRTRARTKSQRRGRDSDSKARARAGARRRSVLMNRVSYVLHRTLHTAHFATSESCHRLPSREASGRSRDRRRAPNTTKYAAPGPARGSVQNFRTIT